MAILDVLLGRPLRTEEEGQEKLARATGVSIFGLDALSSAAYGPEAALTLLIPLGLVGLHYLIPVSVAIIVLLAIVFFSYRQTIEAYPNGGGSYTVASENLGTHLGLLAASALMIDYVLEVAVGISAGVGALISAFPALQPHTLSFCLGILVLLTVINLRGVREAGLVFVAPTYLFIVALLGVICLGIVKSFLHGGHPVPVSAIPHAKPAVEAVSLWLLLKAFASGCTALTGVEAVSNGVTAFKEPRATTARQTLTIIIFVLIVLLAGVAYLVNAYGVAATAPGQPGYQSAISMLTMAVVGRGVAYYITIASVLLVLALSANTAFADFPRLCRAIAQKGYLPYFFTLRGRRLVYSQGVLAVTLLSGILLIIFQGVTDRLIPLFAVGAFLAFTLSQLGMVFHWKRRPGREGRGSMLVNGVGALATGITVCVVLSAKFLQGAWIVVLLIPALMAMMAAVHRHYERIGREISDKEPVDLSQVDRPIVVLPIERWTKVSDKALRFAYSVASEVKVLHVKTEQDSEKLQDRWHELVEIPATNAGLKPPEFVVMNSPYRLITSTVLDYVQCLVKAKPDCRIAVIVPEIVEKRWYHFMLHNQRSTMLKAHLYFQGNQNIVVVNVPWYLKF